MAGHVSSDGCIKRQERCLGSYRQTVVRRPHALSHVSTEGGDIIRAPGLLVRHQPTKENGFLAEVAEELVYERKIKG